MTKRNQSNDVILRRSRTRRSEGSLLRL